MNEQIHRWPFLTAAIKPQKTNFKKELVIRHTLVQIRTPDHLRGRVAAINSVFISASNELGGFESGLTAALFGPVFSVVGGGCNSRNLAGD